MATASEPLTNRRPTARRIMRGRFRELEQALRKVDCGRCTPDELHELRIACRKTEAVLRLTRDAAKSRAWRWLRRNIRLLRRSCNSLRDDDVLCKWLVDNDQQSENVRRRLVRARRAKLSVFKKQVRQRLRKRRLERRLRQVYMRTRTQRNESNANMLLGQRLFRELAHLVQAFPNQASDAQGLHRLRIAGKRMRYAVEAATEIVPTIELGELVEFLRSMQKQLGAIQDQIVREKRLAELSPRLAGSHSLTDAVASQRDSIAIFSRWIHEQPLERILADATAEIISLMRNDPLESK